MVAVGSGIVMFAGQVAGRGVMTMAHRDGLLSSLTGLETITVAVGRSVEVGSPVGTAAPGLHLGFRRDGVYIDPAVIYGVVAHAILVPIPP